MKRSPKITWDQLRVGLVILVALGIIGIAVYKLGQAANLFTKRYELVAYVDDANGLREGGSVMVAGQLAGTVKKIDFLPVDDDTTRNLKLTLAVDGNVQEQIRRDSKGKLRTMGLLGDKVFDITPGTPRFFSRFSMVGMNSRKSRRISSWPLSPRSAGTKCLRASSSTCVVRSARCGWR